MRYLVLALALSGLLAAEDVLAAIPVAGWLIPDTALLVVVIAGLRSAGEGPWLLCGLAGLLKGGRASEPGGLFILLYLAVAVAVMHARGFLYLEPRGAQALAVFAAGVLFQAGWLAYHAAAGLPAAGPPLFRALCAAAGAAIIAPLAIALANRSRFVGLLLTP